MLGGYRGDEEAQLASARGGQWDTPGCMNCKIRCFGSTKASPNGVGRRKTITPPMLSALLERLIEKPELYQDEMVVFLYDEFNVLVTTSSIVEG
jgi:hypothetical protein